MRKVTYKSHKQTAKIRGFHKTLFSFYRKHGHTMPWRTTRDPYRILVSEIMLQQTGVDRVRQKYQEFLEKFPTITALAEASLGSVLRVWSGLGYNRRAKYLHDCAKEIMKSKGRFPKTMDELILLPGIGRSTAAGVMAFAWNLPEPMIDTNIRRVLHRVFFPETKHTDEELYVFAKAMIPKGRGREWNYAMLDCAAMKCTARNHARDCPLGFLHGAIEEEKRKKGSVRFVDTHRYARGRILEALRGTKHPISSRILARFAHRTTKEAQALLQKLEKEGLVVKNGSRYELP